MSWAGLVDLCPCITLTLRDRQNLVEYLTGTASEKRITHTNKGYWKGSQDTQGERYLIHNCKAYPNLRTDVQLSLNFEDHLTVRTRYESRTMDTPKMKSVYACSELNLWDFMDPVFKSYDYEAGVNCGHCHARLTGLADQKRPKLRVAVVVRDLRRKSLPKSAGEDCYGAWHRQARLRRDYIAR